MVPCLVPCLVPWSRCKTKGILVKTHRRDPGVLRPERTRSPAGCSDGDESCVTRFSGGTDEKRRGIPATVRKVVWYGFPGERTRSPAGSRNVNESCVASLVFLGVGGSGRRPSRIRRPRRACGVVQMWQLGHRGVRGGMCISLQPAPSQALSEGLGAPGLDQGAP